MTVYQHAIGMTVYVTAGLLLLLALIFFPAVGYTVSIVTVAIIAYFVSKGLMTP